MVARDIAGRRTINEHQQPHMGKDTDIRALRVGKWRNVESPVAAIRTLAEVLGLSRLLALPGLPAATFVSSGAIILALTWRWWLCVAVVALGG